MVEGTQTFLELPEGRVAVAVALKAVQVVPAAEHRDKVTTEEVLLARETEHLIQLALVVVVQVLLANLLLRKVFEVAKAVQGSPVP
jgi:hypothetical protein